MRTKLFFILLFAVLSGWVFSQTQWELLNPKPTPNPGRGIAFSSADRGYIITDYELLETTDAGENWEIKQNMTGSKDIKFFGELGFIVGKQGVIWKTINSGESWEQISTEYDFELNTVNIINEDTIIISGAKRIIRTEDGGLTWELHLFPPGITVVKTFFTSSMTGHAVCTHGTILKTVDGGLSWYITESVSTYPSNYYTVHFVNENVGYASREFSKIMKTTDGGETWFQITDATEAIFDFHFLNENRGFATGEYGATYKTINGGATWNKVFFQDAYYGQTDMYGIYFHDNNNGFAVGLRGRIIKTTNGGNTWSHYSFLYNDIKQIQVINNTGYILSGNNFYKSTDFGNNWELAATLQPGTSVTANLFTFVNENLGYMTTGGTYGGHVYKTTNGGLNWTALNNGNRIIHEGIIAIHFINENIGFISGGFNQKKTMKTTNGGTTWTQVSNESYKEIKFVNEMIGYACRNGINYGKMYKSTDGGNTWNSILDLEQNENINSFDFWDENNGLFVGNNSVSYKTTNGGVTWNPVSITYGDYNIVRFYNSETGYVLNNEGTIYKTANGGTTWGYVTNTRARSLVLVNEYIFTAGFYGAIYRSYTGIPFLNVKNSNQIEELTVYPNPTTGFLNIKLNNSQLSSLILYNMDGIAYYPYFTSDEGQLRVNLSHLPSGIYILRVNFKNGETASERIILKK